MLNLIMDQTYNMKEFTEFLCKTKENHFREKFDVPTDAIFAHHGEETSVLVEFVSLVSGAEVPERAITGRETG